MAELGSLERRLKKCHHCGRSFSRTEHLQRHQKTHTQEVPFPCPHCHRRFQRSDVQQRHVAKHCPRRQLDAPDTAGNTKHRARVACDFCHGKKLKCCGSIPCSGCEKANRECTYLRGKPSRIAGENLDWQTSSVQHTVTSGAPLSIPSWSNRTTNDVLVQLPEDVNERRSFHPLIETAPENLRHSQFPPHLQQRRDISMSVPAFPANVRNSSSGNKGSDVYPSIDDPSISSSQAIPSNFEPLCQATESILQTNRYSEFSAVQPTSISAIPEMEPVSNNTGSCDLGLFESMQGLNSIQDDLYNFDYNMFSPETLSMEEPFTFDIYDPDIYTPGNYQGSFTDSAEAALSTLESHSRFSRASSPHSRRDPTSWLLRHPSMRQFDRQIYNCFLSKFMKHVAPTFCSFTDFKVDGGTTPEKVLAMAAVGGLFCTTDGSFTVTRAMCSDARRLLLAKADSAVPERKELRICLVQTYMLVELFGICSGDKRLYECSEAFHMQMLQIVSRCDSTHDPVPDPDSDANWQRLMTDINMLECYRVVLFQHPPNRYPISINELDVRQSSNPSFLSQSRESHSLLKTIRALMTPESPTIALTDPLQSLNTLSALLVLSWHSMPTKTSEEGLWNRSFFVLALNRWLKTHDGDIEDSTMLLFHLSSIVLHTSMADIHSLVHNFLQNNSTSVIPEAISQWHDSDHGKIAVLHAGLLIQAAQRIAVSHRPKVITTFAFTKQDSPPSMLGEGPHAAICVYLAVLILWATEVACEHTNWAVARAAIERGCNILSQFKIRIAGVLMNTLRLLEEKVALEL